MKQGIYVVLPGSEAINLVSGVHLIEKVQVVTLEYPFIGQS